MDARPIDRASTALRVVKLVHTLAWAFFAGCIVALPFLVWRNRLGTAVVVIAIVGLEVIVLAANRFRCPLTNVAARYTLDRQLNFDIYLPLWVARYNKHIFGTLYAAGIIYAFVVWHDHSLRSS